MAIHSSNSSILAGSGHRTNAPRTVTEIQHSGGEAGETQLEYYRELHMLQKSVEDIASLAMEVQRRLAPVTDHSRVQEERAMQQLDDPCSTVTASMRELHLKLTNASMIITDSLDSLVI